MAEIVRSKPTVKDANEAVLEGSTSNIRGKVLHTINSPSNSTTDDADTDDYEHNDGKDLDETEPRRTLIRYVSIPNNGFRLVSHSPVLDFTIYCNSWHIEK